MTRKASVRSHPSPALHRALELHRAGRLDAAEAAYAAIKRRDADYAESLRLRGVLAQQRRQPAAAVRLLRRACEQQPANPIHHHTLAEALRANGDLAGAIASYRRAWALAPGRHATGIDLGDVQAQRGDGEAALASYRAVADAAPDHAQANERIAGLLAERGQPGAARDQLAHWAANIGADRAQAHRVAAAHAAIGDFDTAAARYRDLLAEGGDDATACAGLGSVLQSQGDFAGAREWLERALDLRPDIGWVYAALVADRDYTISPAREADMQRLADAPQTSPRSRISLHFALGQLLDRRGETEAAFAHFATANRAHARAEPFDQAIFDDRMARIMAQYTAGFFERRPAAGHASARPVFVVGMPRSGTSLVEQIIASHPQAHGAGELDDIRRIARELPVALGDRRRFPECADALADPLAEQLASRYLATLEALDPVVERVTDKMPFNMLWLGLIAQLFPNARVIYCRREPMDNCLSCYFQIFSKGLRFAYDLGHLGHVYRQHERLMAHWQSVLPLPILTVDYETLVAEPETQSRRLIDFIGLDWDDRCLAFHETERAVRTASVWQVRQPVYASSVARWQAYAGQLEPLRRALERA
ncbi:sulfotransferase [Salinisphaera sp. T31B1]|uniref:tetratricopeptide repeat-containing sulfotransferase family protein n=1 Tax=Salinisphaera sp. T31B1 TaxID=727963 RepID=UPI00334207B9